MQQRTERGVEAVLSDPVADAELASRGIVAVPLLDAATCAGLEEAYWAAVPEGEQGIVLDFLRDDPAVKRRLHAIVGPVIERAFETLMPDHYPIYSSFVVKYPGPDSALFLHRDMAVDDERYRTAYAFWMPLVAVGAELDNGPVAYIPGSELIAAGQCGPTTVMQFQPYTQHLHGYLEPYDLDAGTAMLYDARVLHASTPNFSDRPRVAVGGLLARRGEPVVQVLASGRRHRLVVEVDRAYFTDHTPIEVEMQGMPEQYAVIDEYDEEPIVMSPQFLGPVLAAPDAVREVLVPPDITEAGERRALAVDVAYWPPTHATDVLLSAADLSADRVAGDPPIGGLSTRGRVGVAPLRRDGAVVAAGPAALPDVGSLLAGVPDADLVVLDQEGRASLGPVASGVEVDLIVVECPPVRAGAASAGAVAELDLGQRIPVADAPVVVWNGGPGPVVLVVRRRSLAAKDPAPALAARLVRRVSDRVRTRWGTHV